MRLAPLMCPQGCGQPSTITHLAVGERHHPAVRPVFRTDSVQFLQQAIGGPPAAACRHHDQGCRRGSGDALVAVHVHVPAACDRQPLPESDQSAHVRGRWQPLAPGRPHRVMKRHPGHPPAVAAPERHWRSVAGIENGNHMAGTAEAGSLDRAQARYGHPKGRRAVRRHWSGRPGSNRRHSAWEADVLPLNYARAKPASIRRWRRRYPQPRRRSKTRAAGPAGRARKTLSAQGKPAPGVECPRPLRYLDLVPVPGAIPARNCPWTTAPPPICR